MLAGLWTYVGFCQFDDSNWNLLLNLKLAHVFLASKGVGYFFASLCTYKNNGMSRIFKAKKKKFLLIIQRWVAGWLSDRHMTWYDFISKIKFSSQPYQCSGFSCFESLLLWNCTYRFWVCLFNLVQPIFQYNSVKLRHGPQFAYSKGEGVVYIKQL